MNTIRDRFFFLCILGVFTLGACQQRADLKEASAMDPQFHENLSRLREARIFFGHQSVGQNILEGLSGLLKDDTVSLNVAGIENGLPPGPCLAHAYLGENGNPEGKIKAFTRFVDDPSSHWNIVMLKFCYLDVNHDTDVPVLFRHYRESMTALKKKHPELVLLHATVPLTCENGFKAALKKMSGRRIVEDDNVKRQEYNTLLLREFGNASVFDISRIESTHADGSRADFLRSGKTYFSLASEYTRDGGHLNEAGSRLLAKEFVRVLAGAIKQGKHP